MNKDLISVIIPVYNVEKYLARCVDSVIKQTYDNIEIILVNDGSTDNSGSICDEYNNKDGRIKVIHQTNKGLGGARNTGIKNAVGEWILFLDSDDSLANEALINWHTKLANAKKTTVYVARYTNQDEENKIYIDNTTFEAEFIVGAHSTNNLQQVTTQYSKTAGWAVWKLAVSRELIMNNQLFFHEPIRHAEDLYWILKLFSTATELDFVDICVYNYRVNRQGALSGNLLGMMEGTMQTIKRFEQEFGEEQLTDNQKFILSYLTNVFFYQAVRCANLPKEKAEKRRKLINENKYICKYIDKTVSSQNQRMIVFVVKIFGLKVADRIIKQVFQNI